ncbi:MAG: sigma-54-dependent Fis family transcriptional regulator, partial [Proteobacteria bacterium]|nr:sigma-54-dependent Fis family transcriptional regulator [Pseudomonadota bacterium]
HQDLAEEVGAGRFRADLLYRLNAATFRLPPLRDRHDRAALIETCLARVTGERGLSCTLSGEATQTLMAHDWPGNMRELTNVLTYATAVAGGGPIEPGHLPSGLGPAECADSDDAESLRAALTATEGHATEAARSLGISRATLYRRLSRHGIDPADFRL